MSGQSAPTVPVATTFVIMSLAGQLCGVPVGAVRDVLQGQKVTRVPLAPPDIAGSLNLRGRIVTAVDLRRRMSLPPTDKASSLMSVVTKLDGELYALQVDRAFDVLTLDASCFEPKPATIPHAWGQYCAGIYRLADQTLLIFDLARLLAFTPAEA